MTEYIATTGFFDGVHRGHVSVLNRLKEVGAQLNLPVCVITFWPHPRIVLNKDKENLQLLSTIEEKKQRIKSLGIDKVFVIPFTKEFAGISPEEFIRDILIKEYHVKGLCVGYDHHIGKDRSGGFETIKKICDEQGIYCEQVNPLKDEDLVISSQKIRNNLQQGNLHIANSMLGYSYNLTGLVSHGMKLGRTIGFPTANIEMTDGYKLIPADGVYAVKIKVEGICENYKGMLYIGKKPTVDNSGKTVIEVNIFNFEGDIYNKDITVSFEYFVRGDMKFNSIDDMKIQLKRDKEVVLSTQY